MFVFYDPFETDSNDQDALYEPSETDQGQVDDAEHVHGV